MQNPFSQFIPKYIAIRLTRFIQMPLMAGYALQLHEKLWFKALFGGGGKHTQEIGLRRTSTLQYLNLILELEVTCKVC